MRKFTQVHRLAGTVALAGALFIATPAARAEHEIMTPASDAVKVTWYGQVNRLLLSVNDGNTSTFAHTDNDNSSTRLGIKAKGKFSDAFGMGAKFEFEVQSNPSNEINQEEFKGLSTDFKIRHADVYLFGKWGKLSLGQGDTASNGTSELDLSGTSVIGYADVAAMAGGFYFYDTDMGGISMTDSMGDVHYTPTVGSVMNQMDGLSRDDRLRYDTPAMAGLTLSGSVLQEDAWDAAIRYSGDYESGWKVKAAIAYTDTGKNKPYDQINGSISAMAPMGISVTFASGQRSYDEGRSDDPTFYYGKIGYQAKLTSTGKTSFSLDYGVFNGIAMDNDEAKTWGLQAVQNVDKLSSELFAGFRMHSLDRENRNFDDISAFGVGARFKF